MDALQEWILNIVREGSNVAESLRGSEILIKESLVFAGAILGVSGVIPLAGPSNVIGGGENSVRV